MLSHKKSIPNSAFVGDDAFKKQNLLGWLMMAYGNLKHIETR